MVDVKKPETSLTGRPLFNFLGEISDFDNLRKRVFFSKSPPKDLNSLKTVDRSPVAHQSHQISARSNEKNLTRVIFALPLRILYPRGY